MVRQADPLTPYLFVLEVEILAHDSSKEKYKKMIKLLQYADDTLGNVQDKISAKLFNMLL